MRAFLVYLETVQWAGDRYFSCPEELEACERLRVFLSPLSPSLIQALSDPAMRAALEVILEGLPEVMQLGAKATPGPWSRDKPSRDADGWAQGVIVAATARGSSIFANPPGGSFPSSDRDFIIAVRNLIHRALKAKEEV